MSRYAASAAAPYPLGSIHLGLDGWTLDVEREAPKWGASCLAWHSCQVKSCELVCGESLCEVKIACFCNRSWVLLSFLTFLDSPVVEWKIAWLIMCIWRENYSSYKGLTLFLLTWQEVSRCIVYVWLAMF